MIFILFSTALMACGGAKKERKLSTEYGSVSALQAHLEKDKMTLWTYHKKHIILSTEFNALDPSGNKISKRDFLEKLNTGNYISLEVEDEAKQKYYQILPVSDNAAEGIRGMIEVDAYVALEHFLQEGKDFPAFTFNDLEGNQLTNESLKGKTIFLKTWFIACAPCIEEMPRLNAMMKAYANRDDVVFISLALDEPEALRQFLTKRQFDYIVIANQDDFIYNNLTNLAYPTHHIIGPDGKIKKVTSNFEELDMARIAMGI